METPAAASPARLKLADKKAGRTKTGAHVYPRVRRGGGEKIC